MKTSYTIKKIYENGSVDIIIEGEAKTQNISGVPVENEDALKVFLTEYVISYLTGKGLEVSDKKKIQPSVSKLVNSKITIDTEGV